MLSGCAGDTNPVRDLFVATGLDEGDAEWLVKKSFERTGHPCEFVRASGERRVFAPRTASEWRESLRARLRQRLWSRAVA